MKTGNARIDLKNKAFRLILEVVLEYLLFSRSPSRLAAGVKRPLGETLGAFFYYRVIVLFALEALF